MAFRGIMDGSVEIAQAREARAHQAAMQQQQIRAQMEMQQQQIRAQMGMQQQQMAFNRSESAADRALKQQQFSASTDLARQELQLKQQEFASEQPLREMQITNAKLMLQKAQQDFDDDQAQRAALTAYRQSAFGSGVMSAMLNGVVPPRTLSEINKANGVADGDVGSIVAMGGGPDGAWYDIVGKDGQGNKGKIRQEVDPMAIMAIGHTLFDKEGLKEFVAMYRTRDNNNTKMNLAIEATMKAMIQEEMRAQRESGNIDKKTAGALAVQEAKGETAKEVQGLKNEGNLAVQERRSAADSLEKLQNMLDTIDGKLRQAKKNKLPEDPALVASRAAVQKDIDGILAGMAKTPEGAAPAADAPAASAAPAATGVAKEGKLFITLPDGSSIKVVDTPANRSIAKTKYGVTF